MTGLHKRFKVEFYQNHAVSQVKRNPVKMSLTVAAINAQFLLQRINTTPFQLVFKNQNDLRSTDTPFNNSSSAKAIWYATKSAFSFAALLCIWKLTSLLKTWKQAKDLEQLGICMALLGMFIVFLSTSTMGGRYGNEISFIITQTFKLVKPNFSSIQNFRSRKIKLVESFLYIFCLFFYITFPFILAAIPFIRSYEPLESFFAVLFHYFALSASESQVQICASLFYFVMAIPGNATDLSAFLAFAIIGDGTHTLCSKVEKLSKGVTSQRNSSHKRFQKSFRLYRQLQILIATANEISSLHIIIMTSMGTVIHASCSFFLLVLYNHIPIYMVVACGAVIAIIEGLFFFLEPLSSFPYKCSSIFRQCWERDHSLPKLYYLQMRSCPTIGFSMEMIKVVTPHTVLVVLDVMANTAATLALMSDFKRIKH
ncbi:unnamed protein product [Orchesella dallaii]|uniref:Odorant receptor n=1 Tax=Orchesella dallaii TaxID=48710 RepID=A0ABP1RMW2_9HEXA